MVRVFAFKAISVNIANAQIVWTVIKKVHIVYAVAVFAKMVGPVLAAIAQTPSIVVLGRLVKYVRSVAIVNVVSVSARNHIWEDFAKSVLIWIISFVRSLNPVSYV